MTPRILLIAALGAAIAACLHFFLGGEASVSTVPLGVPAASRAERSPLAHLGKMPRPEIRPTPLEKNLR